MKSFKLLLLILFASSISGHAQPERDEQCKAASSVPLPAEAVSVRPTEFPACEAYKSYAGIGRRVNYAAARSCAWKERAAQQAHLPQNSKVGTSWVIGGDLILVNLYANGLGVSRNLPLALHLACEENAGIAADAIGDLSKLAAATAPSAKRFDVCDSASTTFSMNFCGSYRSEITEERRKGAIRVLAARWTPEQRSAFANVETAEQRYVTTHNKELDQSGTIHTLKDLGSSEIMHNNFLLDLRRFERGDFPKNVEAAASEERMRRQFEANLTATRQPTTAADSGTAVTEDGITEAQAAWEQYRNAWLAFVAVRYPSVPAAAFRAYFAEERHKLLTAMRGQIYRG